MSSGEGRGDASAACDALLEALGKAPGDMDLRERAARACDECGRHEKAVETLRGHFVHLNAHDWGELPCLCRDCLDASSRTTSVGDIDFIRDFAIAAGRLLYFWTPTDVPKRWQVVSSVASNLRQRYRATK